LNIMHTMTRRATRQILFSLFTLPLLWLLPLSITPATAADGPDTAIKSTTDELLSQFDSRRDELSADSGALYSLVDEIVLPRFDFNRMSKLVLGKHWRKSTPEQQGQFVEVFQGLLVRTYASALFEYTGQAIEYKPMAAAEGDEAEVKSEIDLGGGTKIPINYSMAKNDDNWQVYDVIIDGISLVTNYRSSYGREIRKNGIDKLIETLRAKADG